PVFDGMILYLPTPPPHESVDKMRLKSIHPMTDEQTTITLKLTNELPPNSAQCITILNLCNRKYVKSLQVCLEIQSSFSFQSIRDDAVSTIRTALFQSESGSFHREAQVNSVQLEARDNCDTCDDN
ncbi:MAG: hypothetical protein GY854_22195, partial [Deltaproteobacteria bacterium]|nr:hypothetical protein [Deltaproteobacteria bacterium]